MILVSILYITIFISFIYTYPSFIGYFNKDAEARIDYEAINVALLKDLDAITVELKASKIKQEKMQEMISIYEQKLNVKPIIEQHIILVNNFVFPQLAKIYSNAIIEASEKYPNIPYNIILAVMELESTFKYTAKSKKDCIGLMQINPAVWLDKDNEYSLIKAEIASTIYDLYDPTINIIAGTYILNHYYEQIESDDIKSKWEGALMKYFGAQSKEYFEKFQKFFGNFNLYLASYKE